MPEAPFRFLSREEFDRLPTARKIDYLRRAQEELHRRSGEIREMTDKLLGADKDKP